jgi:hypothetical protein
MVKRAFATHQQGAIRQGPGGTTSPDTGWEPVTGDLPVRPQPGTKFGWWVKPSYNRVTDQWIMTFNAPTNLAWVIGWDFFLQNVTIPMVLASNLYNVMADPVYSRGNDEVELSTDIHTGAIFCVWSNRNSVFPTPGWPCGYNVNMCTTGRLFDKFGTPLESPSEGNGDQFYLADNRPPGVPPATCPGQATGVQSAWRPLIKQLERGGWIIIWTGGQVSEEARWCYMSASGVRTPSLTDSGTWLPANNFNADIQANGDGINPEGGSDSYCDICENKTTGEICAVWLDANGIEIHGRIFNSDFTPKAAQVRMVRWDNNDKNYTGGNPPMNLGWVVGKEPRIVHIPRNNTYMMIYELGYHDGGFSQPRYSHTLIYVIYDSNLNRITPAPGYIIAEGWPTKPTFGGGQRDSRVTVDDQSRIMISWEDRSGDISGSGQTDILMQEFTFDGQPITDPWIPHDDTTLVNSEVGMDITPDGNYMLVCWNKDTVNGPSQTNAVEAYMRLWKRKNAPLPKTSKPPPNVFRKTVNNTTSVDRPITDVITNDGKVNMPFIDESYYCGPVNTEFFAENDLADRKDDTELNEQEIEADTGVEPAN